MAFSKAIALPKVASTSRHCLSDQLDWLLASSVRTAGATTAGRIPRARNVGRDWTGASIAVTSATNAARGIGGWLTVLLRRPARSNVADERHLIRPPGDIRKDAD